MRTPEARLEEAAGLAAAIALDVRGASLVTLARVRPSTLIGEGKVEEIGKTVEDEEIALIVVDHPLSPVQQRNLEKAWKAKVIDRTGLILEIFGERARTREGRLQVELAHLTYQRSRLVRSWTHLERQRGGAGFLGGPGETQMEIDRRLLQERIDAIREELEAVKRTRELHRKGRRRVPYPVVALVGYTNAGKSTLFNRLTGASVLAKDMLFATLDPTMREVKLPSGRRIILSDTVGFISELPTGLIAAFRATLEEVIEADIVLHVRDIAHADAEAQAEDVDTVLAEIGLSAGSADGTTVIEVWNKADLLDTPARVLLEETAGRRDPRPLLISATKGDGLPELLTALDARLAGADELMQLDIPPEDGALLAWLHRNTEVIERSQTERGATRLVVRVPGEVRGRLQQRLVEAGRAGDNRES